VTTEVLDEAEDVLHHVRESARMTEDRERDVAKKLKREVEAEEIGDLTRTKHAMQNNTLLLKKMPREPRLMFQKAKWLRKPQ